MPKRASEPDHQELIEAVSRTLYGRPSVARWIPSDEADVFALSWPDFAEERILKIQRPEISGIVWREQALLPALRARGFTEVPVVEFTQDNLPGSDYVFMTMPRFPEVDIHGLHESQPDLAVDLFGRFGAFLRRLGSVPLEDLPRLAPALENHQGIAWMRPIETLRGHPWVRGRGIDGLMDQTADILQSVPYCFGEAGHGIGLLYDGAREFTVVDWGSAGPVWPMYDLASAIGLIEGLGQGAQELLVPPLVGGFRPAGLNAAELRELHGLLLIWQWWAAAAAIGADDRALFDRMMAEAAHMASVVALCQAT